MADDLTIVASILRDTNKKLDKLHADNVQDDSPVDIIKDALPEVLADKRNTDRTMAQQAKHEENRKKSNITLDSINSQGIKQSKIFTDLKKPMTNLGLAIPKSGFNAFSEKASEISAEKSLPSDFKLMMQALTPKALTEGIKVGLGDMFKELGGGIKKIGGGIKSLATKGLTAAQRKSEEKEKESKEKKKDSFLKKVFGSTIKLLGGIFKTASLGLKATGLALLGAGALYALAKLIESPFFLKAAGTIEFALQKLINFISDLGPGGTLAVALGLYYGSKGVAILAGAGIRGLAKKLFSKGAAGTLASSAGEATTSLAGKAGKGGLIRGLVRVGLGFGAVLVAATLMIKGMEALAARNTKNSLERIDDLSKAISKVDVKKNLGIINAERQRGEQLGGTAGRDIVAAAEKSMGILLERQREFEDAQPTAQQKLQANPGASSGDIARILKVEFDKLRSITFTSSNAEDRVEKIKAATASIRSDLLNSEEYKSLSPARKKDFLNNFKGLFNTQMNTFLARNSRLKSGVDAGTINRELDQFRLENIKSLGKETELIEIGRKELSVAQAQLTWMKSNPPMRTGDVVQNNIGGAINNTTIPMTQSLRQSIPRGDGQLTSYVHSGGMM